MCCERRILQVFWRSKLLGIGGIEIGFGVYRREIAALKERRAPTVATSERAHLGQRFTCFKPQDVHLRKDALDDRQQVFLVAEEDDLGLRR